ncbi:MAG: ribonuclease Z [Acidimicrobiaceae bacterium]|nr:ribonuclease Z [Acidimicrobiaceae bacterium]MXW76908.1 ribonuclease Z [Acidimicrobiaceae bacterium]MYA73309.1 ribonuclease Z [Acidimicrobiaceae bacterium]MYC41596.1 ribonuclease Z [Acidimicrobiaceae bacterium]MYD05571.1 ribonuclease Z [Acidimicrobiaceae bacterium]
MMEIVLLGTGSPIPDPNRAGPATLIKAGEGGLEQVLIDAGRGCVMRMAAAGSLPVLLSGVLITHLHSDHLCALNDVITTQWVMTNEPRPLRIWGPVGIERFVDRTLDALGPDIGYRIAHHDDLNWGPLVEISEVQAGDSFELGSMQVSVHPTVHTPVEPTVGYRVEREGKVAALAGDTIPCAGLDQLTENADAYVQTVIRDDLVKLVPVERMQDILDYHSSVEQAAQTATRNKVKTLVLTHLVPAPQPEQYDEWRAVAAQHFNGEIVIGDDLTSVSL